MKILTKENIISFFLIVAIATPIAFIKLDSFPIRLWDESMFAVNSFEMLERGEYIIPYYKGEMNLWNSKPPLLLWIQMLSIKTFGLNELAIRLPSAIAAAATILLMFFFIRKHTNNILAWLTALVLITSTGYFTIHTGRTGDSDALLTLLLTSCNVIFLDSILSNNFSNKRILSFFILLTLAFLCKSFASVLFSLGYLVIIFVNWTNIKKILSKTAFWLGISLFLGICLSFLYLR
ncbi:MAG: glycosyltransferase family 39 protein, partial [Bacteroidia bacterium]|nr:glycosyltransferase family 39 protein [Bacteroidia bacterium]